MRDLRENGGSESVGNIIDELKREIKIGQRRMHKSKMTIPY